METPAPIRLKDALALLEGGAPVSVRFVTCDRRRHTGGEFRELKAARLGSGKRQAAEKLAPLPTGEKTPARLTKSPAHFANATRNLVDTTTGNLVKVHIYLLVAVAGRKVII
ncbi:hypothetical protein J0X19_22145 [Hymenobacter sp. BT186]|uniref:Uncharacterized protein n=1 Tax=Hymenobacter telluris TaxID=2816474 RepID=A0A939F040_9BACT|nr:hypothetical protein [Hymenobacter telluris]MBO0360678.1 hypothetical protein [Hymenobacter telluris]MBW3376705.1 hypothetical protein [Hymenobacter norwichensis]